MTLTMNSRISDLWANPVGRDALGKILLQLGKGEGWITNPLVSHLKLTHLERIAGKRLDPTFFDSLLTLLNSAPTSPTDDHPSLTSSCANGSESQDPGITKTWWKEAVFYQIYPRSFNDSNGDGIGDLPGIIEKLDYLRDLGIDALWLSPIYDSPNDDNGYDIRDYQAISPEFGTMADFDALLAGVHERGMRLIMDLVVNHTSDEHPWFREALADPSSKYRDYYIFRPGIGPDGPDQQPPNNWTSFFSGPAWNKYEGIGANGEDLWALRLFSAKQMDLNWENPSVRREVTDLVNWWLAKGVDGFRLDVINYISKTDGLPDGDTTIGNLMGFTGVEKYFYGPRLHEYLRELRAGAFEPHGAFSVGETPGVGLEMAKLLTAEERGELDMIFSFDQLENPGKTRFDDYAYDLNYLKSYLVEWTERYPASCWMSLFYDNHDNPRMVAKVNPDPAWWSAVAKLLAVIQLTSRGTPFVFQGQEIGLGNQPFTSIDDLRDVESLNLYAELVVAGKSPDKAFARVLAGTRDHARTPIPWTTSPTGGFTTGTPWLPTPAPTPAIESTARTASESQDPELTPTIDSRFCDCDRCAPSAQNDAPAPAVADQLGDETSVLEFYRKLIALRRREQAFVYGDVHFKDEFLLGSTVTKPQNGGPKNYFGYYRVLGNDVWFIECNLSAQPRSRAKTPRPHEYTLELSTHPTQSDWLRPYEANIYRCPSYPTHAFID